MKGVKNHILDPWPQCFGRSILIFKSLEGAGGVGGVEAKGKTPEKLGVSWHSGVARAKEE